MAKRRTVPLSVSFEDNNWDAKARWMVERGFTGKAIARECSLTECQAAYRRKASGFSVRDYRDGKSPHARAQLKHVDRLLGSARDLRREIERVLGRPGRRRRRPRAVEARASG